MNTHASAPGAALPSLAALISFGTLSGAVWLQSRGFAPCPLCILQRMAYLGVLGFALLAAVLLRARSQVAARVALTLAALSALLGLGVALRHIGLVLHPGQLCGLDPLAAVINHWPVTQWLPWLFRADGLCADTPAVFGVALPFWSAAGFVVVFGLVLAALARRTRS